jgi:hypothetical protein
MKAIVMLSMLQLTTVSVISQTKDWSGNRRSNGTSSNSTRAVQENNKKNNREGQTNYNRNSNSSFSVNTNRRYSSTGNNEIKRDRNNDLAENNNSGSRSFSDLSDRRERNTVNQNDRVRGVDLNSNTRDKRNAERQFISSSIYIPDSRHENSGSRHFENNKFFSHHTRIENFGLRGHIRFHHYEPLSVRRIRFPFILPHLASFIWSIELRNEFFRMYPDFYIREYSNGYRIPSVSAYDANAYIGEIATVYGKIIETEYSEENDEYYLYIGQEFPYQDFSIVLPGNTARTISLWPKSFFQGSHIAVTGLITSYNNKPEIVVKRANQIDRYYW